MNQHEQRQKRIALFSALAGYGRCSLTVSLPIISHMKVECCPIPTAVLSSNSSFPDYIMEDYSPRLPAYLEHWRKLGLQFDGICTGFLGSTEQLSIVRNFLEGFRTPSTIVIVDPVLGDHGRLYSSCSNKLCEAMKSLITYADIITPNLTEACLLTDTPYPLAEPSLPLLAEICSILRNKQPKQKIVITGIGYDDSIADYVSIPGIPDELLRVSRVQPARNGTGDIFTSIIAAGAVNGVPLKESVKKAQDFIVRCLNASVQYHVADYDGVCFEMLLDTL